MHEESNITHWKWNLTTIKDISNLSQLSTVWSHWHKSQIKIWEVVVGGTVYTLNIETSPDGKNFTTRPGFPKKRPNFKSAYTSLKTSPNWSR